MMDDLVGHPNACAWQNGRKCIKLQFRDPVMSRKFQRSGVKNKCVGYSVAGGYLRMFTVKGKTLGWFKRWLARNDTAD